MSRNYQQIINETQNPSHDEVSVIWICENIEKPNEFQFTHRNIKINDYGNPVLRMYPNETKSLYKEIYNLGVKVSQNDTGEYQNVIEIKDKDDNVIFTFNNETKQITSVNVGSAVLKSSEVNNYTDLSQFDDTDVENKDLIVIVEENPKIVEIKWNCENPLYLEPNTNTPIDFNITYASGDHRTHADSNYIDILSVTNKYYVDIKNGYFKTTNYKGVSYVTCNSTFADNAKLDVLKIIVCNNREFPEDAYSKFIYNKDVIRLPLVESGDYAVATISFHEYISNGERSLAGPYNRLDDYCSLKEDNHILYMYSNDNDECRYIRSGDNLSVGKTIITYTSTKIDMEYYDLDVNWHVEVYKPDSGEDPGEIPVTITGVEWSLDKNVYEVGETIEPTVYGLYSDNTKKDITNKCTFNYDKKYIKRHYGKLEIIESGKTEISITKNKIELDENNIIDLNSIPITPDKYEITITLDIDRMYFEKQEIDMTMGEEKQLNLIYEPRNATVDKIIYTSTEPKNVIVDDKGVVTALNRGSSEIIATYIQNITGSEEPVDSENLNDSENNSIYLPSELEINTTTNDQGLAEIKLDDKVLLYNVEVKYKNKSLSNINITFENNKEQKLTINVPNGDNKATFSNNIYVTVKNFYDSLVKGMTVVYNLIDESSNIIDTVTVKTNKNGLATIIATDKEYTNDQGIALLDNLRIYAKYNSTKLHNVEINKVETKTLVINVDEKLVSDEVGNITLDESNRLIIKILKNEEYNDEINNDEYGYPVTNMQINVYIGDILVYSDYTDESGRVEITSYEEVNDRFINNNHVLNEIEKQTANLITYDPRKCAVCTVNSKAIDITDIKFEDSEITLDKDLYETFTPTVIIQPENATYKDVSYAIENTNIAKFDSAGDVYGYNIGTTKLMAISKDNNEIKAETTIRIVSHKVTKVTITTSSNDDNYEYYDQLNYHEGYIEEDSHGERVTSEKFDDDDFNRYYLPINNSMQLEATIEPSDANDKTITWLSSNSRLLKVNDKGIITALKEHVKKDLDVYGDDDISESRFANTVWVTALNKKYNKYDICQVRVTQNNIISIDVETPDEHDIDIDDVDLNGTYDKNSEHEFDYIINVGETIEIPISLTAQDNSFGPSNQIKWFVNSGSRNVVSLSGGSPNHLNTEDDFDWNITTPSAVNDEKNTPILYVTGEAIGDVEIHGRTYVNSNRNVSDYQLYIPKNTISGVSDSSGRLTFNAGSNHIDGLILTFKYYSKSSKILKKLQDDMITRLMKKSEEAYSNINTTVSGEANLIVHINIKDSNGKTHKVPTSAISSTVKKMINKDFLATNGIFMEGVTAKRFPDGRIHIIVPSKLTANSYFTSNIKTSDDGKAPYACTFEYSPKIDSSTNIEINNASDMETYKNDTQDYIEVTVANLNQNNSLDYLTNIPIYLSIGDELDNVTYSKTWGDLITLLKEQDGSTSTSGDIVPYMGRVFYPSSEKINEEITEIYKNDNPWDALPGTGKWIKGVDSRGIKVRVVATPKSLSIGSCKAYSDELLKINTYNSSCTLSKWSKNDYKYMMVGYDSDFKQLLIDAEKHNTSLADKYKALAWFSDNEEVIRFEDVEDITSENSSKYIDVDFTNFSPRAYSGFSNMNSNEWVGIRLDDNYKYDTDKRTSLNPGIAINNSNAIIKIIPPESGTIYIEHTGNITYDTKGNDHYSHDSFVDVPAGGSEHKSHRSVTTTYTLNESGYHTTGISAKQDEAIYITGATDTLIYVKFNMKLCDSSGNTLKEFNGLNECYNKYNKYKGIVSLYVSDSNPISTIYSKTNKSIMLGHSKYAIIKLTPMYDAKVCITYSRAGFNVSGPGINLTVNDNNKISFNVVRNKTYYITGTSSSEALISKIQYSTNSNETNNTNKGSYHYKLRPSFIKRAICEGTGTANVYVVSPKGQVVAKCQMIIK